MNSERANVFNVEGHPGAVVWELKEDPGMFYLTNSRGKNRATRKLEAETVEAAIREAKESLT